MFSLIFQGGWAAAHRGKPFYRYFQVYFANMTKVTRILIEHPDTGRVLEYILFYSNDGVQWTEGDTISVRSSDWLTTLKQHM